MRSNSATTTMMMASLLLLSLLCASCQATGLRGPRQLQLISSPTVPLNCNDELSIELHCQGDCNFTAREGTCESKMFHYHGGTCRSASTVRSSDSDSAADCQDLHQGPPSVAGDQVFVVISDAEDPSKNSSMWTHVGGFFWTDYRDYPIGLGLSDRQNITFYSTNETTSYDNMLQTMLFYAPCEGTPLDQLDPHQSVQLFATAVDPSIRALFHLTIESKTQQTWQLQSVSVTADSAMDPDRLNPQHQELVIGDFQSTTVGAVVLPVVLELNRNDTLTILSSAKAITATGLECAVSVLYTGGGAGAAGAAGGSASDGTSTTKSLGSAIGASLWP